MRNLGQEVRDMVSNLNREEKLFFGGPPFSSEINREIQNYETYLGDGMTPRKRICLGVCSFDIQGRVVGYQSSTIMNNSNPTKYEREHIGLIEPISYIQTKKIVVDKDHRGIGFADLLLRASLELASAHKKEWLVDVNSGNTAMLKFLEKQNIKKQFHWHTPKRTLMYRLGN